MKDIRTNLRIMFLVVMCYLLNKYMLRPFVLDNGLDGFTNVFVLSFPNLCEAILGTLLLTNIALVVNTKWFKEYRIKTFFIYPTVVLLAAIYVITQELKIHNLGGRNVYDLNDVLFSIIGLLLALVYLLIKRPQYSDSDNFAG
ncbi:hypothetical protein EJ994_13005 [Maribacter sp. MJ134]|uniref:hypothetical protein n=1 Tax=Maribacter sp. MJ134 TaxID=2496865 RepID=UPI000F836595|nr:hypothetical protein [Maribacter sp. MJ134]AZQ59679.1 hypothetical protein EJ994_13005 [Maribacter sp. MJ134]